MPAPPPSPSLGQALDAIRDAVGAPLLAVIESGVQRGDTTAQGHVQIAVDDAGSITLHDAAKLLDASFPDVQGAVTVYNLSTRRVWVRVTGSSQPTDKLELPDGTAIDFPYAKLSEVTVGNDSGAAIAKSDPPVNTLGFVWRGVPA